MWVPHAGNDRPGDAPPRTGSAVGARALGAHGRTAARRWATGHRASPYARRVHAPLPDAPSSPRDPAYTRRLFAFLGVASFFEGFDAMALSQILPAIRRDFDLGEFQTGLLVSVVSIGTMLAYVLVRRADRVGRKPVLALTIAGYTCASFASGFAPEAVSFALLQLVARTFLIGEWAIGFVYAAEEFPAERRGGVIGVLSAFSSLGAVVCAGLTPLLSLSPLGWRTVYCAGTVPLVGLALARRSLRETARFESLTEAERRPTPLLTIWGTPWRRRMLQLAVLWALVYTCSQTAVMFFKQHAVETLHLPETTVGGMIAAGAVLSMPLVFAVGKLLDRLGRRAGAALVFSAASIGTVGIYTLSSPPLLFIGIVVAVFGAAAVLPPLNALNTELFPTHLRADAFAWSNNLLGRIGYVLAPLAVGAAAEHVGWGPAVASTAAGPILAIVLLLRWIPETRGRELEDTARVG